MFLIKINDQTILYTGDFRFTKELFKNSILYPIHKPEEKGISIPIDHLIMDNTFCDTKYIFPDIDEAFLLIYKIIKSHPGHNVEIYTYNVGKEEIFISLAEIFKTKIAIEKKKYNLLKASSGINMDYFTTDFDEAWIKVKSMFNMNLKQLSEENKTAKTIYILPTAHGERYENVKNKKFYVK